MYSVFYGIIVFATLAMMVREGLWSNVITLVNIFLAGLIAFGTYGPLTITLDEQFDGKFTYLLDFLVLWGLFVIAMLILRTITDRISDTKMRFKHPIDSIGGPLIGLISGVVFAGFVLATMHTAPLAKDAFGADFADASQEGGIMMPDRVWLQFVERMSQGSGLGFQGNTEFSASAFIKIYADHRQKLEKAPGLKVRRG